MAKPSSAAWLLLVMCLLCGCSILWLLPRHGVSSSLVDFLYPEGRQPPALQGEIPHPDLPVRVGLAFIPSNDTATEGLSEFLRAALLTSVKQALADRDFISASEIIPDAHLRSSRGFGTVNQIARLHQLGVIALVSYDPFAISDDTKASIAYWTIVGAYFIPGNKNDVQTFVDTARHYAVTTAEPSRHLPRLPPKQRSMPRSSPPRAPA